MTTDVTDITLTGPLVNIEHRTTRQDNGWVLATVQAATGPVTCQILPRMYRAGRARLDELLTTGAVVTVTGRTDRDGAVYVTDIRRTP